MTLSLQMADLFITFFLLVFLWLLAAYQKKALLALTLLFSIFLSIEYFKIIPGNKEALLGYTKFLSVSLLGLCVLVGFSVFSAEKKEKYLKPFVTYIHIAIIFNILMMVFVPSYDTLRSPFIKASCLVLALWLFTQMAKKNFQTVSFDNQIFLFNASPLSWILCHSLYRLGLITLPIFDLRRYFFLELLSLSFMASFYLLQKKRHKIACYFGIADTLAVSFLAFIGKALDFYGDTNKPSVTFDFKSETLDLVVIPMQIMVVLVGVFFIIKNLKELAFLKKKG